MRWLSARVFDLLGWKIEGQLPDVPKMVIVGAPHTSNWDFFLFLAVIHHLGIRVKFLGKASLFRKPFGWMFRKVGGIPVDRSKAVGLVGQVKKEFDTADEMILVIAPEGTRGAADNWKTGFIEIAEAADVPIVFAGIHAPDKTIHISDGHRVAGDRERLMDEVRAFYSKMVGVVATRTGPIRLRKRGTSS